MQELIKSTTAYEIFSRDITSGRAAHAYMLHFGDADNLRAALKIFAAEFFRANGGEQTIGAVERESYPDLKIYPEPEKKFTAESAVSLIEDSYLKPLCGDKKLYIISGFQELSAVVQNKLLKVIEEPAEGVTFLLGATNLSPVLTTVLSRVRLLEIQPFPERLIYAELEKLYPRGALNQKAAAACGGVFGRAVKFAEGSYSQIRQAAAEILSAADIGEAGRISLKYADSAYKAEILAEAARLCLQAAKPLGGEADAEIEKLKNIWREPALIRGAELYGQAARDLKFNAYFPALLYGTMLKLIEENDRWQRL